MSDVYDYAYIHVMRHPVEVNRYSVAPKEIPMENEVNSSDFSPRDLQIFVDSLETISRLEQAKHAKHQRRKIKKTPSQTSSKRQVTCLDSSLTVYTDEDATSLYNSSESDYIYDETYFGMSSQGKSSATYSNITTGSIRSDATSDSEESGVFLDHTSSDSHVYENIDPIRPRSKGVSHAKGKSLKSRLIALIMKKHYVHPEAPSVELLSSTTIGEQTQEREIYDRVLNDVIHNQFAKNPKKGKKKYEASKKANQTVNAEEKFLDKAMRFLTL